MRVNQVIDLYAAGLISRAEMIAGLFVAPDADGDAIADYLVDDIYSVELSSFKTVAGSTCISAIDSDGDYSCLWHI